MKRERTVKRADRTTAVDRRTVLAMGGALAAAGLGARLDAGADERPAQETGTKPPNQLRAALKPHIDSGFVPGLVAAIWHHGLQIEVLGHQAINGPPMQRDSIFRIASITKPITAAAAMILVEEGKLGLDDPVDDLLPELGSRRVLRSIDAPLGNRWVTSSRSASLRRSA